MTTQQTPPAIEVGGLAKTYGPLRAVDEVSFPVDQGEFFGISAQRGRQDDHPPLMTRHSSSEPAI